GVEVRVPASRSWSVGERAFLVLRPECLRVGSRAAACANRLHGVVERVIYVGDVSRVLVNVQGGQTLTAKLQNSGEAKSVEVGESVTVGWDSEATWLVSDATAGTEPAAHGAAE
ncbi:MAG TPA: TOBE domain-containing protein, partial [Casimicrobiaceae bacterium]|nr:TOBE domain-containing protein [Casimicrobiaceae bacterium]